MSNDLRRGPVEDLWRNPWGRVLMMAMTIAVVSWAVRETAGLTLPILHALVDVLMPLAVGFTIAYVLTPVVDAAQRIRVHRAFAATILFGIFLTLSVLTLSLAVPAVIRQSTDLASRSFQDHYYLDRNDNKRYDPEEPILIELPEERGAYYHDRNDNSHADNDEQTYRTDSHPVRYAPSLMSHALDWLDDQQASVERLIGSDLDARSRAFLMIYAERTATLREILDSGLAAASDGLPAERWPDAFQVDPQALPPLAAGWDQAWPGVLPEDVERAEMALPEADRERWAAIMGFYGRCFAERHRQLLAAWDILRGELDPAQLRGLEDPTAGSNDGALLERLDGLDPSAIARAQEFAALVEAEQRERLGIARDVFDDLTATDPVALADAVRERIAAVAQGRITDDAMEADDRLVENLAEQLHLAREAGVPYARRLFERLSSGERSSDYLREIVGSVTASVRSEVEGATSGVGDWASELVANIGVVLKISLDIVLIPIYAFFLTLAMPGMRRTARRYVPARGRDRTLRIFHDIERVVAAFFRGRLIVCLLCALLVWIGFALIGVPYAGLFGLLIGLATAIPLAGLLFLVPACLLVVVGGGDAMLLKVALIIGVYSIVQTLEMTVFTPMIMGREVELHPVTLIVALLLCGHLLGILGLILAVPIAATVRILAREFILPRLRGLAELPSDSRLWARSPLLAGQAEGSALEPGAPAAGAAAASPEDTGSTTGLATEPTDDEADPPRA